MNFLHFFSVLRSTRAACVHVWGLTHTSISASPFHINMEALGTQKRYFSFSLSHRFVSSRFASVAFILSRTIGRLLERVSLSSARSACPPHTYARDVKGTNFNIHIALVVDHKNPLHKTCKAWTAFSFGFCGEKSFFFFLSLWLGSFAARSIKKTLNIQPRTDRWLRWCFSLFGCRLVFLSLFLFSPNATWNSTVFSQKHGREKRVSRKTLREKAFVAL